MQQHTLWIQAYGQTAQSFAIGSGWGQTDTSVQTDLSPFVQVDAWIAGPNGTVAGDTEQEWVMELSAKFGEFMETLPVTKNNIKDWASSGGDSLAEDFIGYGMALVPSVAAEMYNNDPSHSLEYYENLLTGRLDALKVSMGDWFEQASDAAVDELFSMDKPLWILRTGSRNQANPGFDAFKGAIPDALSDGMFASIPGGANLLDHLDQFVSVDWVSSGDLLASIVDEQFSFEEFMTGGFDIPEFKDHIDIGDINIIESAGFYVPLEFDAFNAGFEGNLGVTAKNISLERLEALRVEGDLALADSVSIGGYEIQLLSVHAYWKWDSVLDEDEYGLGLQIGIISSP